MCTYKVNEWLSLLAETCLVIDQTINSYEISDEKIKTFVEIVQQFVYNYETILCQMFQCAIVTLV